MATTFELYYNLLIFFHTEIINAESKKVNRCFSTRMDTLKTNYLEFLDIIP